jgi:hypothetical protein
MADSYVALPTDSTGKTVRTYKRGAATDDPHDSYLVRSAARVVTNYGIASTFRTPGRASVSQYIFALGCSSSSTVNIVLHRLVIIVDHTALLAAVAAAARLHRVAYTNISNGTSLTKGRLNTTLSANAQVSAWGDASADGTGSGTTLTISATQSRVWGTIIPRMHTAVGQVQGMQFSLLPPLSNTYPVIIRPGGALAVEIAAPATSANPTTNHYLVNCVWEEYTE